MNRLIKRADEDIRALKFNTLVAGMMEFVNLWSKQKLSREDLKRFLQVLAPLAPFISEELWSVLGEKSSIHLSRWPKAMEVTSETVKVVVQVNGRTREVVEMDREEAMIEIAVTKKAREMEKVNKWLTGEERVVFVSGRLVNFVS